MSEWAQDWHVRCRATHGDIPLGHTCSLIDGHDGRHEYRHEKGVWWWGGAS